MDIKPEYQVIHINFASVWFLLNAVRAIKTGWVVQLNGDATFGFCHADIDMVALGFCSFGGSTNPVCFSYIPHQTEGEKLYKVTFCEMQQAVMAVLKAKTVKDCEFSTCVRALKCSDHVATYVESEEFATNQLPIDQAQCDQLPGWACFSRGVFGFPPNICCNHLTGMPTLDLFPIPESDIVFAQALQRPIIIMSITLTDRMLAKKYNLFYKQTLKAKNIAILSFAEHAQALLVDYIRNELKQPGAANWFRSHFTTYIDSRRGESSQRVAGAWSAASERFASTPRC